VNAFQGRDFLGRGGHHDFPQPRVRDGPLGTVGVERVPAFHAETGLEGARRVVEARVNNLRVARARMETDEAFGLQEEDFPAGQGPGHGQTDDSGAHHGDIRLFSHALVLVPSCVRPGCWTMEETPCGQPSPLH
jgi:RES domain-containing protein